MKRVFVDASYWIAVINPRDQWHNAAMKARENLGDVMLVTTEEVLIELLNAFSDSGEEFRKRSAAAVRAISRDPNVKVIPQTRNSFEKGLSLYENRLDKKYSMQDCVSFVAMDEESITDVLTSDHHFEQEGFVILMPTKIS